MAVLIIADVLATLPPLPYVDRFYGNLFFAAFGPDSISKVLGPLQQYKMKVAEAEAKRHPELADAYNKKIQSMKAAGAHTLHMHPANIVNSHSH